MRILITAGPTREFLDPVRFLSNRSSGKMGFALARAATGRGHEVALIAGPVALTLPAGVEVTPVVSAADMLTAVLARLAWCDALIMAAAVADWRPRHSSPLKLKKAETSGTLELERTEDILMRVRAVKGQRCVVGFAAETGEVEPEARRKLIDKGLDLVVGNDVLSSDSGFEVDTNRILLVPRTGESEMLPLMSKDAAADRIVAWIERDAVRRAAHMASGGQ